MLHSGGLGMKGKENKETNQYKKMKVYSVEELHSRMKALGFEIPDVHIVGIRNKADKADSFDDLLYFIDTSVKQAVFFSCTTNAGQHWLQNFMNSKGCAVLEGGQYVNAYTIGKHKGMFEALVQVRPVIVKRDADKDAKAGNSGTLESGLFGINIHQASQTITSTVIGKWSAGCQVLNNPKQFAELMNLCKRTGKKFFTYTLLDEF